MNSMVNHGDNAPRLRTLTSCEMKTVSGGVYTGLYDSATKTGTIIYDNGVFLSYVNGKEVGGNADLWR